jgi:hypothetical protein
MSDDTTQNNGKQPGGVTGKGFTKGDPRINRRGRPKSFDAWRKLLQSVMDEPATGPDGKPIVKKVGDREHIVTNAEMFAEAWMKSKDRKGFAEHAYGKPKEEIELNSKDGLKVVIEYADNNNNPAKTTPGADSDQE